MSDTKQQPKRKRRWLRYSLRTLLIVMTIFCVALGYCVNRANRQKMAVKWVEGNGGSVHYDFEMSRLEKSLYLANNEELPDPKWRREDLFIDYLATVVRVQLQFSKVEDVTALAHLEQLESLTLFGTQVSDLTPLAELKRLQFLQLGNTQVRDLTPLAELKSLNELYLDGSQVSDLTPLAKLKNLRVFYITNTQVTKLQIDTLQRALPNCTIEWSPPDKANEGE